MGYKKFRLEISPKMDEIVQDICRRTGLNEAKAFRNAMVVYQLLLQVTGSGKNLAIVNKEEKVEKIIILPNSNT